MCLLVLTAALPAIAAESSAAEGLFEGLKPVRPEPGLSLRTDAADWYRDAVVYHVWVAAFRDSDGDGVGDLRGITRSLAVLNDLGVTTLWLSPFFKSASSGRNLHGYDVIDHYSVDPRLGSNEDARELIREAHARGLRLIFDLVPNHLSTKHPWFVESRDRRSPRRNWFLWRDQRPEQGWTGFDNRSDWHALDDAWYYGIFWSGMPDLNHRNPAVRLELATVVRHWLDMGFDGLRMDAVKYLYENLDGAGSKADQQDQPESVVWFEEFRRDVLDPYAAAGYAKFMVAENWTSDRGSLLAYMVREGRPVFHMTLNFPMLEAFGRLDPAIARRLWAWDAELPAEAWLGNFTSNHDLAADRPGTLFAGRPERIRAQAAWLLLGPGTPFIYYGNEIAQPQGAERGDIKHRKPLDWAELERQRVDASSVWRWHQTLIRIRSGHASIRRGKARFLETNAGDRVLAIWRTGAAESTLTLFNGQDQATDNLRVTLPEAAGVGEWILGSGPALTAGKTLLDLGPVAPFEVKVMRCRK